MYIKHENNGLFLLYVENTTALSCSFHCYITQWGLKVSVCIKRLFAM